MINMPTLMLYSSTEVKGNIMEREITMKLLLYRRTNDFFFQIFIVKYRPAEPNMHLFRE